MMEQLVLGAGSNCGYNFCRLTREGDCTQRKTGALKGIFGSEAYLWAAKVDKRIFTWEGQAGNLDGYGLDCYL